MYRVLQRVALGGALVLLLVIAVLIANDDRVEVGRLSTEICGTYLDGGNYFSIFVTDVAWLMGCVLLALGAWAALFWADFARRARRYRLAFLACGAAVGLVVAVFVGSEFFVSTYRDAFLGWCPA